MKHLVESVREATVNQYVEQQQQQQQHAGNMGKRNRSCIHAGRELLSKTNLETHKLDLMAEISNLKLRLASTEKDREETGEKLAHAQKRIDELQSRLNDRTIEVTDLRTKLAKNQNGSAGTNNSLDRSASFNDRTIEREKTLDRLKRKHTEIDQLKKAVDNLMVANEEKDQHILELQRMIKRYRRIEEIVLAQAGGGRRALELDLDGAASDSSGSQHTQHSAGSTASGAAPPQHGTAAECQVDGGDVHELKPPLPPMPYPSATSTPVKFPAPSGRSTNGPPTMTSPPSMIRNGSPSNKHASPIQRSSSAEDMAPIPNKTPPTVKRKGSGSNNNNGGVVGVSAQTETDDEALKDEMAQQYKQLASNAHPDEKRYKQKKGIRRFFGKLRRSNSQDLDQDFGEFKRGGVRSTAGARLGWSKDVHTDVDAPFDRWDTDRIALWLHNLGLSMYVGECKRWVKNGQQLTKATNSELEKEMGMRNALHRKKLQLALKALTGPDKMAELSRLDHNWVTRWLDDIGLPQYKDYFIEARVDGRMLNYLTVEDLVSLKVTNALHHLSIKRAIQVLRLNSFSPVCLKRRPAPDEGAISDAPSEVLLWTNHRVMEWLRSIDFSEYAPNLRGSGVHGGLMVLESRFTAELFASILSIPPNKTLLRRHLSTHFVALIGNTTQAKKRESEQQPGYVPLTPNQKVKLRKKLFGHKRSNSDTEDFLCPLTGADTTITVPRETPAASTNGSHTLKRNGSLPRNQSMLAKDQRFLDNVPTSNV